MIDIHCHLLYGVDDGAETKEESIKMLERAKAQGIDAIILTPHYRHGMFPYRTEEVERNYEVLREIAKEMGIELFLGTEFHVNSYIVEYFENGRCHTLGDTKYILTEYGHDTEYAYIRRNTQDLLFHGYVPIVVHVERYDCMIDKPERAQELRQMGAWIQNNADAVLGLEGRHPKKYCKKLLKNGWTDVIASDSHGIEHRVCNMEKCKQYVTKKYGEDYASRLFEQNPGKIVEAAKNRHEK